MAITTPEIDCREQRVTVAEFILDGCANDFGNGVCTATGVQCYNTYNTCLDKCNYVCEPKRFWFTSCAVPPHIAPQFTPNIVSLSSIPTTLAIGRAFSTRGRVKLCLQDAPHNDLGFDPYWPRGAIPICPEDKPGTLLARWLRRVKFFENRRVNIYHGYVDQPLCDFTKETFFIDKVDPSGSNGIVCFTLKDPLILAEDKNAKCPRQEAKTVATQVLGNEFNLPFRLGGALDGLNDPSSDQQNFPYARVGAFLLDQNYVKGADPEQDACFARIRHVCIGKEVLEVRAVPNPATPTGWNLKLIDRASCGSELAAHEPNAQIRIAESFNKEHVADVICRLLTECADIEQVAAVCCLDEPESLIDHASFEAFKCAAPMAYVSAVICDPVGITTLLNELSEQFHFFLYYDSTINRIRIKALAPPPCGYEPLVLEHCEYVGEISPKVGDDRFNEIDVLYGTVNCAQSLSSNNLSSAAITLPADALLPACERKTWKTRRKKEIKSRWVDECNAYVALASGERWACLRECASEVIKAQTTFTIGQCIEYGEFLKVRHPFLQDIHGGPTEDLWMVRSKTTAGDCTTIEFERADFFNDVRSCYDCESECAVKLAPADECGNACTGIW